MNEALNPSWTHLSIVSDHVAEAGGRVGPVLWGDPPDVPHDPVINLGGVCLVGGVDGLVKQGEGQLPLVQNAWGLGGFGRFLSGYGLGGFTRLAVCGGFVG